MTKKMEGHTRSNVAIWTIGRSGSSVESSRSTPGDQGKLEPKSQNCDGTIQLPPPQSDGSRSLLNDKDPELNVDGHDLMVEDGGHGDCQVGDVAFDVRTVFRNQEMSRPHVSSLRKMDSYFLLADGNELSVGTFHRHRISQIYKMDDNGVVIAPSGHFYKAWSRHFDRWLFVCRPLDRVAKKFEVVHVEHFPERTVDIPGEIDDATSGREFTEIHAGDVRLKLTRKYFFHRQVWVARNQRDRHLRKLVSRLDFQT